MLALLGSLSLAACKSPGDGRVANPFARATASPPGSTTAAALPDLCALLSRAEVADAAGTDIPFHRAERGQNYIACAYHHGADRTSAAIYVQYQTGTAGSVDVTAAGAETTVSGMRARWQERGAKLMVAVDRDLLIVNLGISTKRVREGDPRALAVELAERVLVDLL
ncbi:hypothetical protein GCM10009682_25190 [Luedemannella flava]|uniref:DUF3558 domain-containing protein n=1 Tax=Luedemannella flava TaxID=349316 RepID=A0ABN2LXT0_9ACTN